MAPESIETAGFTPEGSVSLDKALIAAGLRNLGRSADGLKNAFLDLVVRNENVSRIDLIEQYPHLQHVDISGNAISSLKPLGALRYLLSLQASDNQLVDVLDFAEPFFLQAADLSRNRISKIRDLSAFVHIRSLVLDGNQIEEISGLEKLTRLELLSLNNNAIKRIGGVSKCPLKELLLNGNRIRRIENIEELQELRVLELRDNQVTSLRGLEGHPLLSAVDLENNAVASVDDCRFLAELPSLRHLNLAGNGAIAATPAYRHIVLFRLPSLLSLDRVEVTPEEKVAAANFHGADREPRREIRARLFPDGELPGWPRTDLDDEVPAVVALSLAMTGTAGPDGFHPSPAEGRPLSESGRFSELARPAPHSYEAPPALPEDEPADAHPADPEATGGLSLVQSAAQPIFVAGVTSVLDFNVADRFAARAPGPATAGVQELAAYLASICGEGVEPGVRDAMRVRAIYRWICDNVAFDVARLQRGYSASDVHESGAGTVLRRRRAVAAGYAELFLALAVGAGLEAALVIGHGKGPDYPVASRFDRHNHTWNAVRVDGAWRLVDCCWGAGFLSPTRTEWTARFLEHYFLTPPHHFVADHLPLEPDWQLADEFPPDFGRRPLTRGEFERRPCLRPAFFQHGLGLVSHPFDACIPATVHTPLSIALEAPPGVGVYASLEALGDGGGRAASAGTEGPVAAAVREQLEATLVVRDGSRADVSVVCPAPGDYVLALSARSSATSDKPQLAITYLVQATYASSGPEGAAARRMASAFPRQTAAFGASEASLQSPLEGALPSGTVQFFCIRLPAADAVAVVDAAGEWHTLQPGGSAPAPAAPAAAPADGRPSRVAAALASAGGAGQGSGPVAFEGRIKVQGTGTLSVHARLPGQRNYTPLLHYQVFPKSTVQLAVVGAAPPAFSVTANR